MSSTSNNRNQKRILLQIGLFIITLITTTLAGAEWMTGKLLLFGERKLNWVDFWNGLFFSIPFLSILTVHEFGHYFTAKYHKVRVTLPFYIPLWLGFLGGPSIGTMGALIKIKEHIIDRKKYFDIGISGPLAGFVLAVAILAYGFCTLPKKDYVFNIHPDYKTFGENFEDYVYTYEYNDALYEQSYNSTRKADSLSHRLEHGHSHNWGFPEYEKRESFETYSMGTTILFEWMKAIFADPEKVPNNFEIMHYPWLFAGFLALFFTSLNLIPIGQLDGGHILYGLIGAQNHKYASRIIFVLFLYFAGLGMYKPWTIVNEFPYAILYIGFLYLCFYRFSPLMRDRWMYALGIFTAQIITCFVSPNAEGYTGWLVFGFVIGRFLGIYHPPVLIDRPLDIKRKILGWFALFVFVISFSPQPFKIVNIQRSEVKSERPSILSLVKPSPKSERIDIPYSLALPSKKSINLEDEIKVSAD